MFFNIESCASTNLFLHNLNHSSVKLALLDTSSGTVPNQHIGTKLAMTDEIKISNPKPPHVQTDGAQTEHPQ